MARSQLTQADCSFAGIAIFSGLPDKTLERLQRQCSWRRYETGEAIVGYLDSSDDVYFIISGEVRVTIYSLAGRMRDRQLYFDYPQNLQPCIRVFPLVRRWVHVWAVQ
jgi:hypothetical protein